MRARLALLTAALLSGPAAAQSLSQAGVLDGHVEIRLPEDAAGPVPAALFFSGCGGVQDVQNVYARTANATGWAAVIVDSHGARGIGRTAARLQVCTGLRLRGQDRAADVFEALDLLRDDARIDAERLVLTGWSHGGWTILDAMTAAHAAGREDAFAGVRGALVIYPYCGALTDADRAPIGDPFPVTMLLVGRDRIADPDDCRRLAERRRTEGSRIDIVFEPDLTHAFDSDTNDLDPRMTYDPEGEARARALFADVLRAAADQ